MKDPCVNEYVPRTTSRFTRWLGVSVLSLLGWQITGTFPHNKKFIIAVAPHTSNWDFVIGVSVMFALNLRIQFLGKKSIFIWPFRSLLTKIGGIPIDRSHNHGVVEQMVVRFNESESLVLALAPEGTRSKTPEWKSGFLHIAYQANVPVVGVSFDFAKKEVNIQQARYIGEEIDRELQTFKGYFSHVCAKNPQAV